MESANVHREHTFRQRHRVYNEIIGSDDDFSDFASPKFLTTQFTRPTAGKIRMPTYIAGLYITTGLLVTGFVFASSLLSRGTSLHGPLWRWLHLPTYCSGRFWVSWAWATSSADFIAGSMVMMSCRLNRYTFLDAYGNVYCSTRLICKTKLELTSFLVSQKPLELFPRPGVGDVFFCQSSTSSLLEPIAHHV